MPSSTDQRCVNGEDHVYAYRFKKQLIHVHSISSNRDSLIGTPLVSLEKYRDNSVFGGKNRGQAINKD